MSVAGRPLSTLVCAVTPFDETGAVDALGVRHLMERFAAAGVGTYIGGSSPGEGYALSLAETEQLYGLAKEAMAGRAEVRAMGVEPRNAGQLLELLRIAESVGLDGAQLYSLDSGHGNKPTPAEIETYFRTLLEGTALQVVISSHMSSGYLVPLDVLARLLTDYPHLSGLNITTPDLSYLSRAIELSDGRADVHVGGPMQALTALALGAQGFLSADGNLVPGLCGSLIQHYAAGDSVAAEAAYARLIRLFRVNTWGGSMRWLKTAMEVLGLPGHHLRPPFLPLDDGARDVIGNALARLELTAGEKLDPIPAAVPTR